MLEEVYFSACLNFFNLISTQHASKKQEQSILKAFLFITCPLLSLTGRTDFASAVLKNSTGNYPGLRKSLLNTLSLRERAFSIPSFKNKGKHLKIELCSNKTVTYRTNIKSNVFFWATTWDLFVCLFFPLSNHHIWDIEIKLLQVQARDI